MPDKKDASAYAPGNITPDGDYVVGKDKPPESGKFRTGDGRQRGRRRKGTRNLATDLRAELDALVTVNVGGATKKISRQRAILMRLADNATKALGHAGADLRLLGRGEDVEEPVQRRGGIAGVHRADDKVAGLGGADGHLNGLQVAELANHDYVGVLAQGALERGEE